MWLLAVIVIGVILVLLSIETKPEWKTRFPFKNIFNEKNELTPVILISAPIMSDDDDVEYRRLKQQGATFLGISSYLEFPDYIDNPWENKYGDKYDYASMVKGWLICGRKVPKIITKNNLPYILLSEADLKNTDQYVPRQLEKTWDLIYSCPPDGPNCESGWQAHIRNWELAKKCLPILCQKYKLKCLFVGREGCDIDCSLITTKPFLPFYEFQDELQKSRLLFAPNGSDASPRVITEALCYNVPVLVNSNIYGGWHNVVPGVTGEFFTSEKDIESSLEKLIRNRDKYTPREWYVSNRGHLREGKRLALFVNKCVPGLKLECASITI